jgi:hypothetical protein
MRLLVIAASALALVACNPQTAEPPAEPAVVAADNNCLATASGAWQSMQIEAVATGATCAEAEVTLTIRNGSETAWSDVHTASQVMVLAGAESVEDMQRRLNEWVNPPGAGRDSTGDLPVWTAGAAQPMSGEFPFYAEEGMTRAAYETLRGRDAPMFCFVQGMESEACLTLENGRVTKIGVQSFPG